MNVTRILRIVGILLVACTVGWVGGCGGNGTTEGETEGDAGAAANTAKPEKTAKAEDIAQAFAADEGGKYLFQTLTIEGIVEKAEIDEMLDEPVLMLKGSGDLVVDCQFEESVMEKVAAKIETLKAGDAVKVRGLVSLKIENSVVVGDCVMVD